MAAAAAVAATDVVHDGYGPIVPDVAVSDAAPVAVAAEHSVASYTSCACCEHFVVEQLRQQLPASMCNDVEESGDGDAVNQDSSYLWPVG